MNKLMSQITKDPTLDKKPKRSSPKRKRVVPLWRRTNTICAACVFAIAMIGSVGTWAVTTGWLEKALITAKWTAIKTSADVGFTLDDIVVTGRIHTQRTELLNALSIVRGAPLLAFDFAAAKHRVESLPWVQRVRIERRLPETLVVHLVERQPIAVWQSQGNFALVDEEGVVIANADVEQYEKLILVVGEDAPDRIGGLLELLATQPNLKSKVLSAVRVGGRRWDLRMENGIDIRLPEQDAPGALMRLVNFETKSGILGRDVKVLDLRLPDRIIVRRAPTAVRKPKEIRKTPSLGTGAGQET